MTVGGVAGAGDRAGSGAGRRVVAGAIIAGGRGARMAAPGAADARGVTKALLAVGGRRIVDRQLEVLRRCFDDVLVVANDPAVGEALAGLSGVRVVSDRDPVEGSGSPTGPLAGPLAGLDAALAALPASADAVVCVAGDMPFIDDAVIALLRDRSPEAMALVPRVGDQAQPLLARYRRACAPVVREQLARGERAMWRLLQRLDVTFVEEATLRGADPDLRSLFNINTPDDLVRAERGDRVAAAPPRAERGRDR